MSSNNTPVPQMSLREWFAGQAVAGLISATAHDFTKSGIAGDRLSIQDTYAAMAVAVADSLIVALARTPGATP